MSKRPAMRFTTQMRVEFTPLPRERIFAYQEGLKTLIELLGGSCRADEPGVERPDRDVAAEDGRRGGFPGLPEPTLFSAER